MPGDYPAIHQGCWFLLGGSSAGFVGAPSILALQLPAQVVGLPVLVPVTWPLHLAPDPLQGGGFPLVAPLCTECLSVSSIKGYRSMLSVVFHFQLPALSSHPVLRDLLHSLRVSAPSCPLHPPSWDLAKVLRFLLSNAFEPLREAPLRALTKKVLCLLALATAKRVGEDPGSFLFCFLSWW